MRSAKPMIQADQAAGLRHMFSAMAQSAAPQSVIQTATLPHVTIVHSCSASPTLPHLILAAAQMLRQQQQRVLMVEACPSSLVNLASAAGITTRYDLLHLLEGDKPYHQVSTPLTSGVTLMMAARGLPALLQTPNGIRDWLQAFTVLPDCPDQILLHIPHLPAVWHSRALLQLCQGLLQTLGPKRLRLISAADTHVSQGDRQGLPFYEKLSQSGVSVDYWVLEPQRLSQKASKTQENRHASQEKSAFFLKKPPAGLESPRIIPYHPYWLDWQVSPGSLTFPASFSAFFGQSQQQICAWLRSVFVPVSR
ncbi:hypothetical protein [Parvibium lacunae]|uniref:Uncharacterized protein n=1 Tax=Parvibium lacunae TaxID=1888893 RepID=A0A368L3P4_9BURK|nr:hypothetical protein [Parvibium lacunae]RCS58208.1 hypothetical protein DU000_05120 [Parvibium lacunae]